MAINRSLKTGDLNKPTPSPWYCVTDKHLHQITEITVSGLTDTHMEFCNSSFTCT